jgi:cell wall-associated NlpC family hydrolase
VSLESIAQVQSRIASIQRQAAPGGGAALGTGASGSDFAALLAQYEGNTTGSAAGATSGFGAGGTGLSADQLMLNPAFGRPATTTPLAANEKTSRFVELALQQNGDRYVMGHEVGLDDADPDTFDCSELVQWAAHHVGVEITDGSWLQYLDLKQKDALMPVDEALRTPGALLFSFSEEPQFGGGRPSQAHVAISLGDGRTIEARGSKYGVGIFEAGDRFEYGGMIPGLTAA